MDMISSLFITDGRIRFDVMFSLLLVYLCTIWLVIVFWVYTDSKRRYQRTRLAIMWAVVVLILNLPALILYLILRPEEEWWFNEAAPDSGHQLSSIPVVKLEDGKSHIIVELNLTSFGPTSEEITPVTFDKPLDPSKVVEASTPISLTFVKAKIDNLQNRSQLIKEKLSARVRRTKK